MESQAEHKQASVRDYFQSTNERTKTLKQFRFYRSFYRALSFSTRASSSAMFPVPDVSNAARFVQARSCFISYGPTRVSAHTDTVPYISRNRGTNAAQANRLSGESISRYL